MDIIQPFTKDTILKNGLLVKKNENRTFSNTTHKNKLKMDQGPKHKTDYYKTARRKYRQNTL